jgi:cystathionine beta-lyase family protein involved in aluminum resistance
MYSFFELRTEQIAMIESVEKKIAPRLNQIDKIVEYNQAKVLQAFREFNVSDFHLNSSTGYGYNDSGRETLDRIYATVFGAEDALVRPHIVSGTHAIAIGLFGLLRPGDELLYITGAPYDTLEEVIGIHGNGMGSLQEWGVSYSVLPLSCTGKVDYPNLTQAITPATKVVAIQRSKGYSWRQSFSIAEIAEMVKQVRKIKPEAIIFVDNCYGEFTERLEPTAVDADIIVGSLIKNPGGGLAKLGGYLAGKARYIEQISYRLTAPGIGRKVGATSGNQQDFYQGFFLAPHFVGEALKGMVLAAALFAELGYEVTPKWDEERTDIIQAIKFNRADYLISFIQAIQQGSPIDSYVKPIASVVPGYQNQVIMAAGVFVQGGTLELSGDAPIVAPYIGYLQGGLTYQHVKWALLTALMQIAVNPNHLT